MFTAGLDKASLQHKIDNVKDSEMLTKSSKKDKKEIVMPQVKGMKKIKKKKQMPADISDESESMEYDSDEDNQSNFKVLSEYKRQNIQSDEGYIDKEDDDEEVDDDEVDDDDDEVTEASMSNKRKKTTPQSVPAKKAKKEEIASIFLGGLDKKTIHKTIKDFFSKNGVTVTDVRKKPGKKFGHCDLASRKDLVMAVKLTGKKIDGVAVDIAETTAQRPEVLTEGNKKPRKDGKKTLVIRNLHYQVTEKDLEQCFENSIAIRIPVFSDTGKSRGKGFVDFETIEDAKTVHKAMNGTKLQGRKVYIEFAPESGKSNSVFRREAGLGNADVEKKRKQKKKEFSENTFEDDSE